MPNKSHQWYILDTSTNKKTKALFEKTETTRRGCQKNTLCYSGNHGKFQSSPVTDRN